jgi:type II secretory pathway component GspD/PulD (secretin)
MKQSFVSWSGLNPLPFIKHMKRILLAFTLVGIVACSLAGFAQTNSPAGDAAPVAVSVTPAQDAVPPAAPSDPAPAPPAPAPAAGPVAANSAAPPAAAGNPPAAEAPAPAAAQVAANDAAQPAAPPATPPAAEAGAPAPAAARPASPAQPGTVIPLIVMDDVPLTDAIRNLARQAGLNYLLDPKIGFGQIGPDGKPAPQPSVSIRWENITAEQALNALLDNYTLQRIDDPKSKIARITTKDPAAAEPLFTKIIQLRFASPSNIIASAQAAFTDKRSKVLPDVRSSQLVVVATEKEVAAVDDLVQRLDTQTRQVLIEARLIETTVNPTTSKGVDWTGTLQAQNVSFGNGVMSGTASSGNSSQTTTVSPGTPTTSSTTLPGGQTATSTTTPGSAVSSTASSTASTLLNSVLGNGGLSANTASGLNPSTFFLNADGVHAVLSFLNTYSESKVLSAPRTVTLDNEPARIEVIRETPVMNVTAGTANTTGGSSITYSNLGVILNVTPRISANDYVNLKVVPEVSRYADTVTKTIAGQIYQADEYDVRRVETRVMIPSGNTLVMGGMISDSVNSGNIKVPLLGDIPYLGLLFRSDTKSRLKQNLLIFITPTIVQDEDFQPTKSTFLKAPVPIKDSVEGDWSAWDSGKPKDWSKKAVPQQPAFDDSLTQQGTPSSTKPSANN